MKIFMKIAPTEMKGWLRPGSHHEEISEKITITWFRPVVPNRGAICNTHGCRELMRFLILYH